jgi:hypothetical protein
MAIKQISSGVLTADGTQQVIFNNTGSGIFMGYLDMRNMLLGDNILVSEYILVNGNYDLYYDQNYIGVQLDAVLRITPKESTTGVRVTVQQIAGAFRQFAYQFIIIELTGSTYMNV